MAENSAIEWTDHTFNPWVGCTKISPGCDHCYAERWAKRSGLVRWGDQRRRTSADNWYQPRKWDRDAAAAGIRQRVFCASLADVFDNDAPPAARFDLFRLINATPSLDWLLLTKRIGNVSHALASLCLTELPVNVWLGATVVNQEEAERDIPKLLAAPARVRFLSCEPLLGPIDLNRPGPWHTWLEPCGYYCDHDAEGGGHRPGRSLIDWVIVGGESGGGARPMHPDWATSLRDQCIRHAVPFFFKQWGEYIPMIGHSTSVPVKGPKYTFPDGTIMGRAGKKAAGRLLEGMTWNEIPGSGVSP